MTAALATTAVDGARRAGRFGALAVSTLRRLLTMAVTLLVTSFVVFSSLYLAPGDPVSFLVRGRSPSPQEIAAIREQYGFNDPFPERYWHWLQGVLQGDLGRSYLFHQSVDQVLWSRLPASMLLVGTAALMIAVVGVGAGIVGALRRGTRTDTAVLLMVTVGAAVPSFVAAITLRSVLGVRLGWFPTIGNGTGLLDRMHHVVLPAIALSVTFMALVTRVTRSAMLDELRREHVEVALSRGMSKSSVVRRHVLRNALGPIVTVSGLLLSGMLVSTAIVETAFGMSGVGSLLVQAVNEMDFQVVQAIVLLVVAAFVVVNTLVDLVYPLIDPRVAAAAGSAR
ncbi:ABC transporter permease [Streptomyces sp. So13.3]|uniref:ABC transporter permease n=1 Tax=Streptomyces sp. So13.3 TaxID=2136173 RepID=UPI0011058482|nr:ABC transporter permease [Streptomyces sp. So13.3]QNA77130.1 ABC transporter permease [Streptomyces sp. So13.3]